MDALVGLRKKTGVPGGGGKQRTESQPYDVTMRHAVRCRCRSRLAVAWEAQEDDGRNRGRMRGLWSHRDWDKSFAHEGDAGCHCRRFSVETARQVYKQTHEFV